MPDTFAVTIISIIGFTLIAAFIRGRTKDKCLKSFSGDTITLEKTSGKTVWGRLHVENTGLELIYSKKNKNAQGSDETSYILYKQEYSDIQALIRYHDKLNDKNRKDRDRELEKIYHPFFLRKLLRKTQNIFKTVRDSLMDVVNLLIGQTQKTSVGRVLKSQEKYVSGVKKELAGAVEVSYEPLLERYIGNKVILRMTKGDKTYEFRGVLRDYTAEFMEIMDVDYSPREDCSPRKADLVILRTYGMIRHLGE